jgi:hypothetical protein
MNCIPFPTNLALEEFFDRDALTDHAVGAAKAKSPCYREPIDAIGVLKLAKRRPRPRCARGHETTRPRPQDVAESIHLYRQRLR